MKVSSVGWEPAAAINYAQMLDDRVCDILNAERLQSTFETLEKEMKQLEEVVATTAAECRKLESSHRRKCKLQEGTVNLIRK